ncbi:uncharacterized protein LOC119888442 [Micropterus salmoides]|uniref:uncharacterized protein LOC119888442 n=1 Tax=Micropterus salmoides TaxID=27706 RepID=UPI0018EDB07C|nr:uncharacterized protein LOC119888442 [Micropterus salmoides]
MEKAWMYNDRGNARRRALKTVSKLIENELDRGGMVDANLELGDCVDDSEESEMLFSDEESDQCLHVEEKEVYEETVASVEDLPDLGEQCSHSDGDLRSSLADWAVEFGISLIALSALLSILKICHPSLPKDGRTLLKTKTCYNINSVAGGVFHYCGILNSIRKILDKVWSTVPDGHAFKLQLNFDGLPLCKSTSTQFWPILGMLQRYTKKPMLIGLFCGTSKPNSLAEYLHNLVQELKMLKSGFLFKQKTFFVNVVSVVCDTPARAFIRGVKSHTGYHGCDKCHQTGVRKSNRMTFPEVNARRRTDDSFRQAVDEEHHIHHSPLADVGIDMVACFPYDYMHLVCLGVMRRLLDLWISTTGPLRCRISSSIASMVTDRLLALKNYIPSEFARRPRALAERYNYNEARLKLPQAVDHTDLGSDGGDLPIKFKRKRIRKNILFPGEDDDEMESTLKVTLPNAPKIPRQYKTPTLKPGKQGQNLQPSGNSSPDFPPSGNSSPDFPPSGNSSPDFPPSGNSSPEPSPSQHSCTSKFPSSCHTNTENRTPRHASTESRRTPRHASTESRRTPRHTERSILPSRHPEAHQTREQTSSLQTSLLRSILTKQEMMMDQLRIIFKTLQGMKATDEAEIGLDRNLLPVKDVSSLQNLEEQLQSIPDLQKQLVNTLALKGGTDIRECVWRIMHAMITNSLAKNINMRGINGKIGFQRLQIRDVVIAAVRRNRLTSGATDQEIDSTIKRWLHLAPDRDGGRRERMRRKEREESRTAVNNLMN